LFVVQLVEVVEAGMCGPSIFKGAIRSHHTRPELH
jgi:hypothetical protein